VGIRFPDHANILYPQKWALTTPTNGGRSVGRETEITQEIIQDWLQLDEVDPGFQLLTEEEIATVIFLIFISISTRILFKFPFICFLSFVFCIINPDYPSIRMTSLSPFTINLDI
jgi:hypothetical protein